MNKGNIIDIVPLIRLPLNRQQYFSYLASQEIPVGSLVSIPLFRRQLQGIVINNRRDFERMGNIRLKPVSKIVEEEFLTEKQLEIAKFISKYYFCSLGVVLKSFIPKTTKSKNKEQKINISARGEIRLSRDQKIISSEIMKINSNGILLFGPAPSERDKIIIQTIKKLKAQSKNSQFLILLPEILSTVQIIDHYQKHFDPREISVLHSRIAKGQYYINWLKIKSGEAKIIIGTRMSVLAPFRNLRLIVIGDEQDISFKQWDMNPRYDARKVADKLAEIHQAKVVRISSAPSLESYARVIAGEIKLLKLSSEIQNSIIVDMRREHWIKNYSPISQTLKSEINYALNNKQPVILFVNRQGGSYFSVCNSCKTVLKCPRCDLALSYSSSGTYKCLHCNYKTGIFPACAKCGEKSFKNLGLGTEKIEKEINILFPSARARRVDAESLRKTGFHEKLFQDFSHGKIDILIGTQMIIKGWDLPQAGLVGIISADSMLNLPDYTSNERAFQNMTLAAGLAMDVKNKRAGKIIIQTYDPDNFLIKAVVASNFEEFYEKEFAERKALKYAPFSTLIKLIFQNTNKKMVDIETKRIYESLQSLILDDIHVSRPHKPLVSGIRGRFRKQIIIKMRGGREIPNQLEKLMKGLSSNWIIDIDPISII